MEPRDAIQLAGLDEAEPAGAEAGDLSGEATEHQDHRSLGRADMSTGNGVHL